jgi:acetyl-CoA carboxylase carboxyl transferase subunit alpha
MGAPECLKLGVIDAVIAEPIGGAHRNPDEAAKLLKAEIDKHFKPLLKIYEKNPQKIKEHRFQKFRKMGESAIETITEVSR